MFRISLLAAALSWPALATAGPTGVNTILDCDFNSKTIDQLIGTGGPSVGEPIALGEIPAIVRSQPFSTPCLEMSEDWGFGARALRFEFLGGVAISTGNLDISFKLYFHDLNGFAVYLRESSFSAISFMNLIFTSDGSILIGHLNSPSVDYIGTYTTGTTLRFVLSYDLNALTFTIASNNDVLIQDEPLGEIPQGIGAILFGLDHDADSEGTFFLDDLFITASDVPEPVEASTWSAVKALMR